MYLSKQKTLLHTKQPNPSLLFKPVYHFVLKSFVLVPVHAVFLSHILCFQDPFSLKLYIECYEEFKAAVYSKTPVAHLDPLLFITYYLHVSWILISDSMLPFCYISHCNTFGPHRMLSLVKEFHYFYLPEHIKNFMILNVQCLLLCHFLTASIAYTVYYYFPIILL